MEVSRIREAGAPSRDRKAHSLGFWSATALVVAHTIGVGIFLTPAQVIGAVASPTLTLGLWLACGLAVFFGACAFGELASRCPQTGGLYVYLREAFGDRIAFLYGWLCLLVVDPGVTAALAAGTSQYLSLIVPEAAGNEKAVAIAVIWTLSAVAMAGLRPGSLFVDAVTLLKVATPAAIVAIAFARGSGSWKHFEPFFARAKGVPPIGEAVGIGLVSVFFSFGGFWEASRVAGETRDPDRTMPRALAAGVAVVTLVYLATTVAFIYLVPPGVVSDAAGFARRAGAALLGAGGPAVFAAFVVVSAVASAGAFLLMAPRVYLAMSRDGLFPDALAKPHPATQAPVRATALLATLASLLVLSGSFGQILAFFMCPTLVFVGLAASSLFVLRRGRRDAPIFRSPGHPVTTGLFIALLLTVVLFVAVARPLPALAGFGLVLAGVPVYRLLAARRTAATPSGGLP